MNPFAKKLSNLRHAKKVSQKALAIELEIDPTYLCALEAGRKNPPRNFELVRKISERLKLTDAETIELLKAAELSQRRIVIPSTASEAEYRLVAKVMERVGSLKPAQIAAMMHLLEI